MLNISYCDKQRGVSPTGPCGDKQAVRPDGLLWPLSKHDEIDERRPQSEQAGTAADGAVAVVALTAAYISVDDWFDLRIDGLWADVLGGAALRHDLLPRYSHWERVEIGLAVGSGAPAAIIPLSSTWFGDAVVFTALTVQGSSACLTIAVVTFFPIGNGFIWLCKTDNIQS